MSGNTVTVSFGIGYLRILGWTRLASCMPIGEPYRTHVILLNSVVLWASQLLELWLVRAQDPSDLAIEGGEVRRGTDLPASSLIQRSSFSSPLAQACRSSLLRGIRLLRSCRAIGLLYNSALLQRLKWLAFWCRRRLFSRLDFGAWARAILSEAAFVATGRPSLQQPSAWRNAPVV